MTASAPTADTLVGYLKQIHARVGTPGCRAIATAIGTSHTWVADMLGGRTNRPSWDKVHRMVAYLGGNPVEAKALWAKHMNPTQSLPKTRPGDQPLPQGGEGRPIHELVIEDIQARMTLGVTRYGRPLRAHDGRNSLLDLYEELLDAAAYIRKLIEERDSKEDDEANQGDQETMPPQETRCDEDP